MTILAEPAFRFPLKQDNPKNRYKINGLITVKGECMDLPQSKQDANRLRTPNTARLMKLPVRVAVHLAERKIELSQLLGIAPGTLLTFDKSCEELLDLYVNNQLYARGETVKIGEKFGLKINEIGDLNPEAK